MNLRNIEFLLEEAFTGIRRNGLMAYASISTIALSLGVLGAFVLMALSANNFASEQIGQFQIAVFTVQDADQSRAEALVEKISKMKGVGSVKLHDRRQEWKDFKRENPQIESAGLPLNPLPYALTVKASDPARLEPLANEIRRLDDVNNVKEGRKELQRVTALAQALKAVSVIGAIVLLVTTAFIVSNAIRLTLYARRREIRIMQLVGATNETIRIPLVIEGMAFGASGAIVAWLLLRLGGSYVTYSATTITPLVGRFTSGVGSGSLAFGLLLVGTLIGAIGSLVSIRRFLKD